MILDLGLPDIDGVEIIKKGAVLSNNPIIVVSARSEDGIRSTPWMLGRTINLTKPFSVEELWPASGWALRKMNYDNSPGENSPVFVNGSLKIDYSAGCVYVDGREIHLTPIEYKLLCLLALQRGQGAHPQLHSAGGVGQRLGERHPISAGCYGYPAQKIEKNPPGPSTSRPMWGGVPDDPPSNRRGERF